MNISQRDATLADLKWLDQFYESIMRPYVELTHPWDPKKFRQSFQPHLTQIIQVNGVDIGMLKVEDRGSYIYLGDLQIHPIYQNQGVGTHLIQTVIGSATALNKPVRLRVLNGNPAKRLYLRLGFQELQHLDHCVILEYRRGAAPLYGPKSPGSNQKILPNPPI